MSLINKNKPFTYDELKSCVAYFEKNFPFMDIFSLGKSVLKKELYCFRLGKGGLRIFINGAHHGTEWITSMMLCEFVFELARDFSAGKDSVKKLLFDVSYYICPMVNPDGVNLSINGPTDDILENFKKNFDFYKKPKSAFIGKWQANARGVDLNHNYPSGFNEGKMHEKELGICKPASTRFSGTSPLCEPESSAMVRFTRMLMPYLTISYHTQGEEIYYSYMGKECKCGKAIAQKMAHLTGYKLSAPSGMASFSGYKDWVIDALSIPSFTIEAGKGKNPLPLSDFDDIYKKNKRMLLDLFTNCLQFEC